jgi:hypothetical protein
MVPHAVWRDIRVIGGWKISGSESARGRRRPNVAGSIRFAAALGTVDGVGGKDRVANRAFRHGGIPRRKIG